MKSDCPVSTIVLWFAVCIGGLARGDFYAELAAPCRVSAEGIGLRELVSKISATHKVNIWLDRRIDPSLTVSSGKAGQSVEQTLVASIAGHSLGLAIVDGLVIIGPGEEPILIANSILLARQNLRAASTRLSALVERHDLSWQQLDSPVEVCRQISSVWNVPVQADSMPHDLWAAAEFREIDGASMLELVASGFGLQVDWAGASDSIGFREGKRPAHVVRKYSSRLVSAADKSLLKRLDSQFKFKPQGAHAQVAGNALVHHELQKQIHSSGRKKPAGNGSPTERPLEKRFSGNLKNYCREILKFLAGRAGFELDIAAASDNRLARVVSVSLNDTQVTEIVRQICAQAELECEFREDTVIIKDP